MSLNSFPEKLRRRLARLICRYIQLARIFIFRLVSTGQIKGKPKLYQPLQTAGLGVIDFSGAVNIGVFPSPFFLSTYCYIEARNKTAMVSIGEGTWINNNFCAIAEHTFIRIGCRVLIGPNVEIYDSDFHGITVENRTKSEVAWARPVIIEDDVFIGANARILKGVTVGKGAVIANGAIVTKHVPPGVVVGGNPAKIIRMVE